MAIQTNIKTHLAVVLLCMATLAGCASQTRTEGAPVDERAGGGAGTSALPEGQGAEGGALGNGGDRAALLAKKRVYFAFDSSTLDDENRAIVEAHAAHLANNTGIRVNLEGHADERGTREYNLALGERRAQAVERVMRALGVAGNRISTTSYGEEKPLAGGHDESAWRQNRRVEISYR
jgi:peptidoglycan-associated lipoprotein